MEIDHFCQYFPLVGIITLKDMLKFLALKIDLEGEKSQKQELFGMAEPIIWKQPLPTLLKLVTEGY
jgi:hypothetical protein